MHYDIIMYSQTVQSQTRPSNYLWGQLSLIKPALAHPRLSLHLWPRCHWVQQISVVFTIRHAKIGNSSQNSQKTFFNVAIVQSTEWFMSLRQCIWSTGWRIDWVSRVWSLWNLLSLKQDCVIWSLHTVFAAWSYKILNFIFIHFIFIHWEAS